MELTKKNCEQALKDWTFEVMRNHNNILFDSQSKKHVLKSRFQRQHDLLEQLIKEHFDNPPLNFEELHEGMWVWDNKHKVYNKVRETYTFNGTAEVVAFFYLNLITQWNCSVEFEENRFYRKEVKE